MDTTLKRTALYETHVALNARMVPFAGWEMPVMYGGILEEARAVRTGFGLFDISHMGRVQIHGEGATDLLQKVTSNNVAALSPSEAQYSLLTNPEGGIVDDIIVYRQDREAYLVVVNASNKEKDLDWIRAHRPEGVTIDDQSEQTAMIAVQGPDAPERVAQLAARPELLHLNRFAYATGMLAGASVTLCRTGYTGEDGFELIVPARQAETVWNALVEAGGVPCGLGARDALRIEAGYPLYGHEIDDSTNPVEAGLMWVVRLDKGPFIGREAIAAAKQNGVARKLVGLVSQERSQPRQGYTILAGGQPVGQITSGIFSPMQGHCVAMGYVAASYAKTGTGVAVEIRGKHIPATVVPKKSLLQRADP